MINKGGFYVRFLNGSLPSFEQIFEDLAPSFVILSQRLNTKLLDKSLFTLDRDDTIGGTRVDDMVITMHQITSQIIHMIRNNTTEWTDTDLQDIIDVYRHSLASDLPQTQSQISSASINHESQQFELEELPSLSPQSQSESSNNHNHNISSASTSNSNHISSVSFPWMAVALLSSTGASNSNHNRPFNNGSLRPTRRSKRALSDVEYYETPIRYPPKRRRIDVSQSQQQPSSHDASDEEVA
eukprot:744427_1